MQWCNSKKRLEAGVFIWPPTHRMKGTQRSPWAHMLALVEVKSNAVILQKVRDVRPSLVATAFTRNVFSR